MHAGSKKLLAGAGHAPTRHPHNEERRGGDQFCFSAKCLQIHGFWSPWSAFLKIQVHWRSLASSWLHLIRRITPHGVSKRHTQVAVDFRAIPLIFKYDVQAATAHY